MARATVGSVTAFDKEIQPWEEYVEILEHFFLANGITDESIKKSILLSSVGGQTYSLIRNLLRPETPGEKTFNEIVDLLKAHFNSKPSEIVQRFKFNSRIRNKDEKVMDYVTVLRKLAQDCNYGNNVNEMLRDRLVCGINDDRIQRRLLSESGLTFDNALTLAQAIETTNKDVREFQGKFVGAALKQGGDQASVYKINMQKSREEKVICSSTPTVRTPTCSEMMSDPERESQTPRAGPGLEDTAEVKMDSDWAPIVRRSTRTATLPKHFNDFTLDTNMRVW